MRKPFVSIFAMALIVALGTGTAFASSMAYGGDSKIEAVHGAAGSGAVAMAPEDTPAGEAIGPGGEGERNERTANVWPSSESAGMMAKLFMMATVAGAGPMSGAALMFR